jgi:ISXO2-like transposase domain
VAQTSELPLKSSSTNNFNMINTLEGLGKRVNGSNAKDNTNAIQFAMDEGLIQKRKLCNANHECKISYAKGLWRCRIGVGVRKCNFSKSIFVDSWFSQMRISLPIGIKFLYCWAYNWPKARIMQELEIKQWQTVVNQSMMLRELCAAEVKSMELGGIDGPIVEIDESKFGKNKYHRGSYREGWWVFGAVERREDPTKGQKMILYMVADRTAETLESIIKSHVLQGSKIYSDCWAGYKGLSDLGYLHQTVNHSKRFKEADGTCTNRIEGAWKHAKNTQGSGRKCLLPSYLAEFCWRQSLDPKENKFEAVLQLVRKFYHGVPMSDEIKKEWDSSCPYVVWKGARKNNFHDLVENFRNSHDFSDGEDNLDGFVVDGTGENPYARSFNS